MFWKAVFRNVFYCTMEVGKDRRGEREKKITSVKVAVRNDSVRKPAVHFSYETYWHSSEEDSWGICCGIHKSEKLYFFCKHLSLCEPTGNLPTVPSMPPPVPHAITISNLNVFDLTRYDTSHLTMSLSRREDMILGTNQWAKSLTHSAKRKNNGGRKGNHIFNRRQDWKYLQ